MTLVKQTETGKWIPGTVVDSKHGGALLEIEYPDGEVKWTSWTHVRSGEL